jgi:hypothetical protein
MKPLRLVPMLALLLWSWFALSGFGAMSDIAGQGVPGHPNTGQRNYYLHIPLAMAFISLLLSVAPSWREKLTTPAGCLGGVLILSLFPYLFFYTGGV